MAVPFRRVSKAAKGKRRSHIRLAAPTLVKCPNCGEYTVAHQVCKSCGYYNNKQII